MYRLTYILAALILASSLTIIDGINPSQKPTSGVGTPDFKPTQKEPDRRPRAKPMSTPDLYETKINDFPEVAYPMSILDMKKSYTYDPVAVDPYAAKPEFDRSVQPEKLTANLRKKLKHLNSSSASVVDSITKITSNKNLLPTYNNKTKYVANTAFSGKFAPQMGTNDKPNYYNSRQWARKLAILSKGSRLSPTVAALATGHQGQKAHNSTSVCASMWSKDIPVIQVIDNAITMIERMINSSMLFNPDQHPSITIKEAKKLISIVENIQEILAILDCLNGVESSLYYNVKTGVTNKTNEEEKIELPIETDKSVNSPIKDENTTVTVIQIVDHAITIVEDLLNSTVLQNIEKNSTKHNVVLLSADEAEEMVNVVETIKDILAILEELNGNVSSSVSKIKNNDSVSVTKNTDSENELQTELTENVNSPTSKIKNNDLNDLTM